MNFVKLREDLLNEKVTLSHISSIYKDEFIQTALAVLNNEDISNEELKALLQICNDVYTYSDSGEVMIPDSLYDQLMSLYVSRGNEILVYADTIGKEWNLIKHEIPGVVGTIAKVYTYKELKTYLARFQGIDKWILSPKYDGISCALHFKNGVLISAATRYDGLSGQDITNLIINSPNIESYKAAASNYSEDVYFKCELCITTESLLELNELRMKAGKDRYKNRRSATSGVINTPSNIEYGKYVSIVPLIMYLPSKEKMTYLAPFGKEIRYSSPADMWDELEKLLKFVKKKDFPYRVDGIVINPDRSKLGPPNEADLMDSSIAFKINTMEGRTNILYGYMSIGRLGKGVPMVKVEPVEVNETIVEDVSLGSYDKFLSMELNEGEEIIVYSAGDVIPQVKLPEVRSNIYNNPPLKIKKRCPYCGEKLARENTEYYCKNPKCLRIITGRIANFLDKVGVQGFSDKTVEAIHIALGISTIHQFLNLSIEDIMKVDGFDVKSATSLYDTLCKVKNEPIGASRLLGALGIERISEKKCKKIFESVNLKKLLKTSKFNKIEWDLQEADGIGPKTAKIFMDYIRENQEMLNDIVADMNVCEDAHYVGNVVFTGFRPSKEIEDKFRSLGYDIGSSVTSSTIAVVAASTSQITTKLQAALKKGIAIYTASQLNDLLNDIADGKFRQSYDEYDEY